MSRRTHIRASRKRWLVICTAVVAVVAAIAAAGASADGDKRAEKSANEFLNDDSPVTCTLDAFPFRYGALRRKRNAERGRGAAAKVLRRTIRKANADDRYEGLPARRWVLLGRKQTGTASYVAFGSGRLHSFAMVVLKRPAGGYWRHDWSVSDHPCNPRVLLDNGRESARWWVDASDIPREPNAQQVTISVSERDCHGFDVDPARVSVPLIRYSPTRITLMTDVKPLGGPATCPGTPPIKYTLELSEPIGDRELVDGGNVPQSVRLNGNQQRAVRGGADGEEELLFDKPDVQFCIDYRQYEAFTPGTTPNSEQVKRMKQRAKSC